MPSWGELISQVEEQGENKAEFIEQELSRWLDEVGNARGGRNVIAYGSAFLQKPQVPPYYLQIQTEDLNGFMSVIHRMPGDIPLTLLMHTPGGQISGTETIVSYLLAKFSDIEVIVPAVAMSAGTMVALAANRIILSKHSQLGPIDPQMAIANQVVSAQALLAQFNEAKKDIVKNPATAAAWAPMLNQIGPAGVVTAQRASLYSKGMVEDWLKLRMFAEHDDRDKMAQRIAEYFWQSEEHLDHGKRIGYNEAEKEGVVVEKLEDDGALQDAALTVYHMMTIIFQKTPAVRIICGSNGSTWFKNFNSS